VVCYEANTLPPHEVHRVGKKHLDSRAHRRRRLRAGTDGGVAVRNAAGAEGNTQEQGGNTGL
jgi:hypothetical protein